MPLIVPAGLPAAQTLAHEGISLPATPPAGVRPLRVLLLNLMPEKMRTELDFARMFAPQPQWMELTLVKIAGQTYKTTPTEHMDRFYVDFDGLSDDSFDGLVVTGAPLEHLPFGQVRYWPQLCRILDWAENHVRSTLCVCWGAQAALYHRYGIDKHTLPHKMFGVFDQQVLASDEPLLTGMEPSFPMPHSRHTEVRRPDFPATGDLRIVAESAESGVGIAVGHGRTVYDFGHLEYEPLTLDREFRRDTGKGLPIDPPRHYYRDDTPGTDVVFSWHDAALRFYANWVEHYVAPPRS